MFLPISGLDMLILLLIALESEHRGSAIDADDLPSDEGGLITGEVRNHRGDFLLACRPAHWDYGQHLIDQRRVLRTNIFELLRLDRTGCNRVDGDAIARELSGKPGGHAMHPALGRVICRMIDEAIANRVRADVNDAPIRGGFHVRKDVAATPYGGPQIAVDGFLQALRGVREERANDSSAGVIDQDINASEVLNGLFHQALCVDLQREVAAEAKGPFCGARMPDRR